MTGAHVEPHTVEQCPKLHNQWESSQNSDHTWLQLKVHEVRNITATIPNWRLDCLHWETTALFYLDSCGHQNHISLLGPLVPFTALAFFGWRHNMLVSLQSVFIIISASCSLLFDHSAQCMNCHTYCCAVSSVAIPPFSLPVVTHCLPPTTDQPLHPSRHSHGDMP